MKKMMVLSTLMAAISVGTMAQANNCYDYSNPKFTTAFELLQTGSIIHPSWNKSLMSRENSAVEQQSPADLVEFALNKDQYVETTFFCTTGDGRRSVSTMAFYSPKMGSSCPQHVVTSYETNNGMRTTLWGGPHGKYALAAADNESLESLQSDIGDRRKITIGDVIHDAKKPVSYTNGMSALGENLKLKNPLKYPQADKLIFNADQTVQGPEVTYIITGDFAVRNTPITLCKRVN